METNKTDKEERIKKIQKEWKDMHGKLHPCFEWENHELMDYWYNPEADTIECDCGISIPIDIPTEEINEMALCRLLDSLEIKIYLEYKNKGINLGYIH